MTTTTVSPHWFKSSYSSNGGDCVEVSADLLGSSGVVPVRDSKELAGPVLSVSAAAFTSFVAGIKSDGAGLA